MRKALLILLLLNLVSCGSIATIGTATLTAIVGMCAIVGVKDGK